MIGSCQLGYIAAASLAPLLLLTEEIGRIIAGLRRSLTNK
jgi:hypothetical protein